MDTQMDTCLPSPQRSRHDLCVEALSIWIQMDTCPPGRPDALPTIRLTLRPFQPILLPEWGVSIMLAICRIERWRAIARTIMFLVLAMIALDLWDASCYPLFASQGSPTLSSEQSKQSDACAGVCVPDCFCCSSATPAAKVALTQEPTPLSDAPVSLVELLAAGFSPVIDHIPITTV